MTLFRETVLRDPSWKWAVVTFLAITLVEAATLSGVALLLGGLS